MMQEHPSYALAMTALQQAMTDRKGLLIAIDGWPASGKSTLSRYLAWRLHVYLIETDLFAIPENGTLEHQLEPIRIALDGCLGRRNPRHVIVEGATVLQVLEDLGRAPDFHINVATDDPFLPELDLEDQLNAYEAKFSPKARANLALMIDWPNGLP